MQDRKAREKSFAMLPLGCFKLHVRWEATIIYCRDLNPGQISTVLNLRGSPSFGAMSVSTGGSGIRGITNHADVSHRLFGVRRPLFVYVFICKINASLLSIVSLTFSRRSLSGIHQDIWHEKWG